MTKGKPKKTSSLGKCCGYSCVAVGFAVVFLAIFLPLADVDIDVTVHSCKVYIPPAYIFDTISTIMQSLYRYIQEQGVVTASKHLIQLVSSDLTFLSPPLFNHDLAKARGKKVLMVGGSYVPKFLKRAKQMEIEVYLLDDAERTSQTARSLATGFIPIEDFAQTSILHPEKVVEAVRQSGLKFDGVTTLVEDEGPLTARLAREFSLPGSSEDAAKIARNKFLVREAMAEHSLPTPSFALINDVEDIENSTKLVGFPSFLKPVYGVAASYVSKVKSIEEVKEKFHYFQNHVDRDYFPIYHYGTPMMLEGMLGGAEIQLELLFLNGELQTHCFSSHYSATRDWVVFPTNLTATEREKMLDLAVSTSKAIGITHGVVHYELFYDRNRTPSIQIIEVNNRLSRGFLCLEYRHQLALGACLNDYFGSVLMLSLNLTPLSAPRYSPITHMATFMDAPSKTGWETESSCAVFFGLSSDEAVRKGLEYKL